MLKDEIIIKGVRNGVLITIPPVAWFHQRDALITRIQTQERFFKGGRIALDVGASEWNEDQLSKLLRDLSDEGVSLWAILSSSPITLAAAQSFRIDTSIIPQTKEADLPQEKVFSPHWVSRDLEPDESMIVDGDLILVGNVPKGAALFATGSLLIWGSVEGSISAGTKADLPVVLYVLNYDGTSIKLCGFETEIPRKWRGNASIELRMKDGSVEVKEAVSSKLKLL